jgi:hypothetical protein
VVAFLASGLAYCWLAYRAGTGRRWRLAGAALVVATLVAYVVNLAAGEEADQVGIATGLIEIVVLGLAISGRRRVLAAVALVLLGFGFGTAVWISTFAGHAAAGQTATGAGHHHGGQHLARAQAGILMRPGAESTSPEQARAAAALAASVQAATEKYRSLDAAVADGYRAGEAADRLHVHYENPRYQRDGAILDPARPEMLVYAQDGDRAALLGVVFQMPEPGQRGPQVGGASATWHRHNICVGLLPPGFGPVTPYGTCPFLAAQVTIAEMMHVWIVPTPSGPFADDLPDEYARRALAAIGGR